MPIDAAQVIAAFQARRETLRVRLAASMAALWGRYGGPSDAQAEEFLAAALPVVQAGQAGTVTATDAYLALALGRAPVGLDIEEHTGAALRGGTAPREVYLRPVITLRAGLSKGYTVTAANRVASARLAATADTDLQLAHRKAAQSVFGERNVSAYRRVTTARSCGLCGSLTGRRYRSDALMPVHHGCDCTIAPIVGGFDPRDAAVLGEDLEPTVVHEHGELGPVLTVAGQHFTGPNDL